MVISLLLFLGFFRSVFWLFIVDENFVTIGSKLLVELFQAALDHGELCAEFTFVHILLFILSFFVLYLESSDTNLGHLIHAILVESLDLEFHLVFLCRDFWLDFDDCKVVRDVLLNKVWMLGGEELSLLLNRTFIKEIEFSISFFEIDVSTSHGLSVLVIYASIGGSLSNLTSFDNAKSAVHFFFGLLFGSNIWVRHPLVSHNFGHCRPVVSFQLKHTLNEILERLGEEIRGLIFGMTPPENISSVCSEAFVEWIIRGSRVERWMLGDHDKQNDG